MAQKEKTSFCRFVLLFRWCTKSPQNNCVTLHYNVQRDIQVTIVADFQQHEIEVNLAAIYLCVF